MEGWFYRSAVDAKLCVGSIYFVLFLVYTSVSISLFINKKNCQSNSKSTIKQTQAFLCLSSWISEVLMLEKKVLPSAQHQCKYTGNSHLHISRTQQFALGLYFSCRKLANVWEKVHQNYKGSRIDTLVTMYVDYTRLPAFEI
jgi:predicted Kef-type K+ transport protein